MKRFPLIIVLGINLLFGFGSGSAAPAPAAAWQHKVDPVLLADDRQDFLVVLREQADLRAVAVIPTREARTRAVVQALQAVAAKTQSPLLAEFDRLGLRYRAFWVVNMIWVQASPSLIPELARRPDVARLVADRRIRAVETMAQPAPALAPTGLAWNVAHIRADLVWAQGVTGQGVTIAGQDTGYQWNHPALKTAYRGWDGVAASHDYNWHDAIHSAGSTNPCGSDTRAPCDDYGHGTHTMGIMVGNDEVGNQIGVAPGARWIGCRNMDAGVGSPSTYSECFQWFLAPTDLNDQNPRPDLAPSVINNSWSCPPSEGCDAVQSQLLQQVVQNVRAAGILVVVSAGNNGPGCNTITNPPATFEAAFSVGAVNSADQIALFSSRGPTPNGLLKPDVSAPGVSIWSSIPGNAYGYMSGTSMAAPHVVALAALLISANPALDGQVERLEAILQETAIPLASADGCGGYTDAQVPNPTYGYGRVDALAAFQAVARRWYLPLILELP